MRPKNTKQTTKKTAKPKQSASTTRKAIIGKKKFRPSKLQVIIASIVGLFAVTGVGYWMYSSLVLDDASAGGCVNSTYKQGSRTACVKYMQQLANGVVGTGADIKADGIFGAGTTTKIKAVQKKYKLTQDGIVGSGTWEKLCSGSGDSTAKSSAGCGGSASSSSKVWTTVPSSVGKLCATNKSCTNLSVKYEMCKQAQGSKYAVTSRITFSNVSNPSVVKNISVGLSSTKLHKTVKSSGSYPLRSGLTVTLKSGYVLAKDDNIAAELSVNYNSNSSQTLAGSYAAWLPNMKTCS